MSAGDGSGSPYSGYARVWEHESGPYEALGQRFVIRCDSPPLGRFIEEAYGALRTDAYSEARASVFDVYRKTVPGGAVCRDGVLVHRGKRASAVLLWLSYAINQLVTNQRSSRVILHAAAASDADGRTVVLPAPMESGKTTLVAGLVRRGLTYLSDEAVAYSSHQHELIGYAKPLSLEPGSWNLFPELADFLPDGVAKNHAYFQWLVPPQRLGNVNIRGKPAVLIFPIYQPGASTTLRPLSGADALRLTLESAFPSALSTPRIVAQAAELVARSSTYRLEGSNLSETCASVIEALESSRTDGG